MEPQADIFEREQKIVDQALEHCEMIRSGSACGPDEFRKLTREYEKLLKQLRRITKLSDNASNTLNTSKNDLSDRVNYDALTGIFNRRYLEDNLGRLIKTLARSGSGLSVLFMDVDYFKKYNDHYGHGKGDECLQAVGKVLGGVLTRSDDFVARYGGEEFVMILPNTCESGARLLASRILERVRAVNIPHAASDVAECVTVSIGVTTATPVQQQNPTDFVSQADAALYEAKHGGRNRYVFLNMKEVD